MPPVFTTVPPGNVYVEPEQMLANWLVVSTESTVKVVVMMLSQPFTEVRVSMYMPPMLTTVPPGMV